MRPLEFFIPILLIIYTIWPLFALRPVIIECLPLLTVLVTFVHIFTEGIRWQMVPLYIITAIILIISVFRLMHQGQPQFQPTTFSRTLIIANLLLLAVFTALPVLLPVPTLAKPDGPYTVGTRTLLLTDENRKELYSGNKDDTRKFMVELWYPAKKPAANVPLAPWMPDAKIVAPAIADYLHLPHFFLDHLTLAKSWSYNDLPIDRSAGPYPILVFSHGWNGFRQQSTFLMEDLASHGYIVVAMQHPYGATLTVLPDGTLIPNNPEALPKDKPDDEYEAAARILVNQWAGDMGFTLDYLARLNENDPGGQLTNLLDLQKVGIFGHSTGGGATIQFCGTDPRCKAGLTLDAFMRPVGLEVLDNGTKQPFFFMFSELWPFKRNSELFDQYYSHVDPSNQVVTIMGADHYDFSDLPALSPLAAQLGLKGPINGARVQNIIQTYVLAFFDQQLKGIPSDLFTGPQEGFPELKYRP